MRYSDKANIWDKCLNCDFMRYEHEREDSVCKNFEKKKDAFEESMDAIERHVEMCDKCEMGKLVVGCDIGRRMSLKALDTIDPPSD